MLTFANKLTFLRILLIFPLMALMLHKTFLTNWMAFITFSVASLLDYFDGFFARKRGEETKLGALLDPIADKLLVVSCFVLLLVLGGFDSDLSALLALLMILRDVFISGIREYLAHYKIELPVSKLAKGKTAFQLLAIAAILLPLPEKEPFPDLLIFLAAVCSFWSAFEYSRKALKKLPELKEDM